MDKDYNDIDGIREVSGEGVIHVVSIVPLNPQVIPTVIMRNDDRVFLHRMVDGRMVKDEFVTVEGARVFCRDEWGIEPIVIGGHDKRIMNGGGR